MEADRITNYFDPEIFAIKLTPLNPTATANSNKLQCLEESNEAHGMVKGKAGEFVKLGYEVIESVGNMEENFIGSNCGQMVRKFTARMPEYEKAPA